MITSLRPLLKSLQGDSVFAMAIGRENINLCVPEVGRAFILAALAENSSKQPLVVVYPTNSEAERAKSDIALYLSEIEAELFPAWETLPFERVSPAISTMGQRLRVLHRINQNDPTLKVIVTSTKAVMQRLGPHVESSTSIKLVHGCDCDQAGLITTLAELGYRREHQVEHRGEFSVRGSIVDVYPSTGSSPIRIDLWGDEIERLCEFSPADQRSIRDLDSYEIYGAREVLPTEEVQLAAESLRDRAPWARELWDRLASGLVFDGMESLTPWLNQTPKSIVDILFDDALVIIVDPSRVKHRADEVIEEEQAIAQALVSTWVKDSDQTSDALENTPRMHLPINDVLQRFKGASWSFISVADSPETPTFKVDRWGEGVGRDPEALANRVGKLVTDGIHVIICAETVSSAPRIAKSFIEAGLTLGGFKDVMTVEAGLTISDSKDVTTVGQAKATVIVAPLEHGFVAKTCGFAVLSETDITGRRTTNVRKSQRVARKVNAGSFFDDLKVGDYVVHHHHGIGRFMGMVKRSIGGVERDYLLLEYRGDDKLYIPSDQIDLIRPYSGSDSPSLHKLGGSDWRATKSRVRSAVVEIAQELVVLYQRRQAAEGFQFSMDTPWQREMEEAFPFNETLDQLKAISEVKADMERSVPMDRLICGDVGFGKTEVALRAAFKAIQDGKQVAVLVPTTLLARQHAITFKERFAPYPVRVEMMSRFLSAKEAKQVVGGLADKTVDIVIGTHRLLAQDVKFKDLGLLIVDEEQRFGVDHKEQIKKLRTNVDVLTLSATPIPRTLEMSLTGIRDLTLLQTPPAERQPILTYVGESDEHALAESIRRELLREGQVFYVHNRVASIEDCARRLRELVPEARIAVAHGQMDETQLERIVVEFWEGAYDVLVCTTIIESGIDMPTVNTLVVERADLLGLGQLHQIRGRVGRAGQRAYAYLFYPPDVKLSEEAYERLRTIGEHTELGSGFKIAMRDLQIRGAGNLLGGTQSGHIASVGYDLYVQMVSEAVGELKGEQIREPAEIKIDLQIDANLPTEYMSREDNRLDAYRRLATVETPDEVSDIRQEWTDRFGVPPRPAETLLEVARLRAACVRVGVREVTMTKDSVRVMPIALPTSKEIRLKRMHPKAVYKKEIGQLQLPILNKNSIMNSRSATHGMLCSGPELPTELANFLDEMIPAQEAVLTK